MQENQEQAINLILTSEGGYVDHPHDPGGATNLGVTLATLAAWRQQPVTKAEVRALERPEAIEIYEVQYADKISFALLPLGVDYCVLDCAVNSGPGRAALLLQKVLRVAQDGVIGLKTLAAARDMVPEVLLALYNEARLAFLRSLRNWKHFGTGWRTRVERVGLEADRMARGLSLARRTVPRLQLGDMGQAKGQGPVRLLSTVSGASALATAGTVLATAGAAATQASGLLLPYEDIAAVRYALLGCAVVSALGTLSVAMKRATDGATT